MVEIFQVSLEKENGHYLFGPRREGVFVREGVTSDIEQFARIFFNRPKRFIINVENINGIEEFTYTKLEDI